MCDLKKNTLSNGVEWNIQTVCQKCAYTQVWKYQESIRRYERLIQQYPIQQNLLNSVNIPISDGNDPLKYVELK